MEKEMIGSMAEALGLMILGVGSGFFSGLLGIGGGIILLPSFVFILHSYGFSVQAVVYIAPMTSLAVYAIIGASSAYTHLRQKNVSWQAFSWMFPGLLVGSIIGRLLANTLSARVLYFVMGTGLLLSAMHVVFASKTVSVQPIVVMRTWLTSLLGFVLGNFATMLGVAGGVVMVPYFLHSLQKTNCAVGTSALCGWGFALAAVMIALLEPPEALPYSPWLWGPVYWPAVLYTGGAGVVFARMGACMVSNTSGYVIRWVFVGFMLITAFQLFWSGVYDR